MHAPGAAVPNCHDRLSHQAPGVPNNPFPCAGFNNPRPRQAAPPGRGTASNWWELKHCADRWHAPYHAGGYTLCRYCMNHTEQQPWWRSIYDDVTLMPPPLPGPGVAPVPQPIQATAANPVPWTRFFTYLCRDCEFHEQNLLAERLEEDVKERDVPNSHLMRRGLDGFPENTCTCLGLLEGPRSTNLCIRCRYPKATDRHDRLLMIRQQNDQWLRRSGRNNVGKLVKVHGNRTNARANRGVYRACRCGKELGTPGRPAPQVLMCMGCEGVAHLATAGISAAIRAAIAANNPVPTFGPTAQTRRAVGSFGLRRCYEA